MTKQDLGTLSTMHREKTDSSYSYEKDETTYSGEAVEESFQAGFILALQMVSEAMNEGKDLIEEFDEVMN